MKQVVFVCILIVLVCSDIRISNNQLTAEGQWSIRFNPKSTEESQLKYKVSEQKNLTKTQQDQTGIEEPQQKDMKQNIFELLTQKEGACLSFFYDSNLRNSFQNKQKVDTLSIRFHDPKYIDQKIIVLRIPLENYLIDTDNWQNKNVKVNYTYFEELSIAKHGIIMISYRVDQHKMQIFLGDQQVSIKYQQRASSTFLPLFILLIDLVLLYLAIRFQKIQIAIQKISIVSLYHCIFFFIYLSTFFMIIGMSSLPKPMSLLLLCGCIQILISVKLIRKFESIIHRISNIHGYCVFYCGIFLYVCCLFNYYYSPVFILINSLFLVPQIVHNVRFGNKLGGQFEYLTILASTQLYFIYLKGYSDNVLRYHPQPFVCVAIVLLVALQVYVVTQQNKRGPYFFIRKDWLPNYFNYYKTFKLDSKSALYEEECSICLDLLSEDDPITSSQKDNPTDVQLKKSDLNQTKQVTLMITPCQHKFHPKCLEEWLQYKRQCPVDRSSLPILYK